MASASGSWRGSYMREDDIERLVRLRRVPREVVTRAPGEEVEPRPEPGERVVFGAHLDRGLGLPASAFFRRFLDNFGLQPHHLPANACILLSCYVAFMEAYAGLWPDIDFWSRLFYLKTQTTEGRLRACGAASIYTRPGTPFPKIPTVDSVKNWQMSFFYVRNEGQLVDRINLPEFNPVPPVGRINWSYNARTADPDAEVNQLWDFLGAAVANGLTAEDLLCTIAERRVLPLQMRTHKIGHMSGRFDPNRTAKALLSKAQVAHRVNNVTKANMPEEWNYGLAPRDRDDPPELLFDRQNVEDGDLATKRWVPDHADPADQAGDQAGDDDLLQAPDLGGQGEHNPPPSPEQQEDEEPATSATGPLPVVPLRARPPSTTATSAPRGKKRAGDLRSTAALEAKVKKLRRLQPRKGCHQVCPGRRLPADSACRVAASSTKEGVDAAASIARTYAAAACGYSASAQGRLPSPCRWPQRLIAARGSSRRASRRWTTCSRGLVFWTQPLGPAGACRLRPKLEPAALHRPRPEPEPGRMWWCWMKTRRGHLARRRWLRRLGRLPPSAATTGSDDGGADQAGAGKG
ncbi:hypothetical protein QYE76_034389 [Lolium multiflorum]|uniref:Transposase (putative) gypsy type domain-containing protein n=1 Tax=Lolium multiflorum TaxID=4521 RepID=A0AAD8VMI1_LOLMU|nr:hypothetical protein QYE76_034389 [Lolium multiflorum]